MQKLLKRARNLLGKVTLSADWIVSAAQKMSLQGAVGDGRVASLVILGLRKSEETSQRRELDI